MNIMDSYDPLFERVYVAGHAGMVGSAILRRMKVL
jgi:nucleoside-diphosphate-sugar epimerase